METIKKIPPKAVPSRDERYMGLALWIAAFSKDHHTQMGAIIVSADNEPLGMGYNGPPRQIKDSDISWGRPEKYDYIIHAEKNAISHCLGRDSRGSTLYVTGLPCKNCMIDIVNAGIKNVVYFPYESEDEESTFNNVKHIEKTKEIAKSGSVFLKEFSGNLNWMRDRIKMMESINVFGNLT